MTPGLKAQTRWHFITPEIISLTVGILFKIEKKKSTIEEVV